MKKVKAKKFLGQHFLRDNSIAYEIVESLKNEKVEKVLEVGPGMGVLTEYLLEKDFTTYVVEIDTESVEYLKQNFTDLKGRILEESFLGLNLKEFSEKPFSVIGNFPYNISSQILFKVLENRDQVVECVGMFQKEVAERVAAKPGKKTYGILSVLLQAFYNIEYLFTVDEHVFIPPPKVKSGVIRLSRNTINDLGCKFENFKSVVKLSFNQRRKTLRNSLKSLIKDEIKDMPIFGKRPEQLSVEEFIELTKLLFPKD